MAIWIRLSHRDVIVEGDHRIFKLPEDFWLPPTHIEGTPPAPPVKVPEPSPERRPAPSEPPPTRQRTRPGRPRIPPPVMLQNFSPDQWRALLPVHLFRVGKLDIGGDHAKSIQKEDLKRSSNLWPFIAFWQELQSGPSNDLVKRVRESISGHERYRPSRFNVLLTNADLVKPLNLDEVADRVRQLPGRLVELQVFYLPPVEKE